MTMIRRLIVVLLALVAAQTWAQGSCPVTSSLTLGTGVTLAVQGTGTVNGANCQYNYNVPLLGESSAMQAIWNFAGASIIQATSAPGAPTLSAATPSVAALGFTITPPTTGGGYVTSYTVSCVNGSNTLSGSSSTATVSVTGLTASTTYTCSATATNTFGTGPASNTVSGTTSVATGQVLTVTPVGSGTITDSTSAINCGTVCSGSFTSSQTLVLTATPATNFTFVGWQGASCQGISTCSIPMTSAQSVSATFVNNSVFTGTTCAQNSSSVVQVGDTATQYSYQYHLYGNYIGQIDVFGTQPGTSYMWMNSSSCWGASATSQVDLGTNVIDPQMPRGWTPNSGPLQVGSTSGYPSNPNFTTLSGMGIQVSSMQAGYKVHAHWAFVTPSTPNPIGSTSVATVGRWDALMDCYFHSAADGGPNPPSSAFFPTVDMQIYQALNDQPLAGQAANLSGYWSGSVLYPSHPFVKTISGVTYVGAIDIASQKSNDTETGAHTISLFVEPTQYTNSSANGGTTTTLWGLTSVTHDIGALVTWLATSTGPLDNSGNPIMNAAGVPFTGPVINPAYYLDAITPGFEIDFGTNGNNQWTTINEWIAVGSEADGPATP